MWSEYGKIRNIVYNILMNKNLPEVETEAILSKIGDAKLKNVSDGERKSAVDRAVRMLGIDSRMAVESLIKEIETHEAQLSVHTGPSDPEDVD